MDNVASNALEPDGERMREMVNSVMDHIVPLLTTLNDQPMDGTADSTPEFLESLIEPLPQSGANFDALMDQLFDDLLPKSVNTISGGFMAYIGCGGIFEAAVADLIANSLNRYTGTAAEGSALVQIEANVVRWFCDIMGLPDTAGGFLCSGGSIANLSGVITARHIKLGEDFSRGTIYISDQTHHCVAKAVRLAGIPRANLRVLPADEHFRLDPERVRAAIKEDRDRGMQPFLLVGSGGTTNTGAIDPLDECADLAREEDLWFHVDGAYGGFFRLTERGKQALKGIERADSVVLDPHKTLFLPYGTGALVVRDRETLLRTHRQSADYMPDSRAESGLMEFCELSPELTKPFRGLRVWLPMKLHGVGVFRDRLDEKLDLIRWVESRIREVAELEVLAEPELSVVAFAIRDTGQSLAQRNAQSRQLINDINARQHVFLSSTSLNGVFALRIAIVSFRTHKMHLQLLVDDLKAALGDMAP